MLTFADLNAQFCFLSANDTKGWLTLAKQCYTEAGIQTIDPIERSKLLRLHDLAKSAHAAAQRLENAQRATELLRSVKVTAKPPKRP
jgi:hypothetical protein